MYNNSAIISTIRFISSNGYKLDIFYIKHCLDDIINVLQHNMNIDEEYIHAYNLLKDIHEKIIFFITENLNNKYHSFYSSSIEEDELINDITIDLYDISEILENCFNKKDIGENNEI